MIGKSLIGSVFTLTVALVASTAHADGANDAAVLDFGPSGSTVSATTSGAASDSLQKSEVGDRLSVSIVDDAKFDERVGLERASEERVAKAVGHYARARSLLIAAINEFDSGYRIANTDALLDSKAFRQGLLTRSKELERVLAPQPRVTNQGVRFNPDHRLIGK